MSAGDSSCPFSGFGLQVFPKVLHTYSLSNHKRGHRKVSSSGLGDDRLSVLSMRTREQPKTLVPGTICYLSAKDFDSSS